MTDLDPAIREEAAFAMLVAGSGQVAAEYLRHEAATPWHDALRKVDAIASVLSGFLSCA